MASVEIQKNVELELRANEEVRTVVPVTTGKFLMTDPAFFVVTNQRIVLTARSNNPFMNKEKAKSKEETINFADIAEAKARGGLNSGLGFILKMKDGKKRNFVTQSHKYVKGVWVRATSDTLTREQQKEWNALVAAIVPAVQAGIVANR
jgi:hypothetical protein